jgi:hypothetical protein
MTILVSVYKEMASDTVSQNEEHINIEPPPARTLRISIAEWSTEQSFNSIPVPQHNKPA